MNVPRSCPRPLWLVSGLVAGCRGEPVAGPPPDVLLVVLDTLRADALHSYGGRRPISNQLDAVAQAGVLFEDVTAPALWTYPSHASVFTGQPPWVHGAHYALDGPSGGVCALRPEVGTLAERFAAAGYETVSLSANCWVGPDLGLTRGFERARCQADDGQILSESMAELRAPHDRPLFLFVNLLTAHSPYLVQEGVPFSARHAPALDPRAAAEWVRPYLDPAHGAGLYTQQRSAEDPRLTGEQAYTLGRFDIPDDGLAMLRDLYDGGVAGVDASLKALVEAWNDGGHSRGIVAVASDHGEALGDGHRLGHWGRFAGDVLRVPLVLVQPGALPRGLRVSQPVSLTRLYGTLLDLSGVEPGHADSLRAEVDGGGRGDAPVAALWWPGTWSGVPTGQPAGIHFAFRTADRAFVVTGDQVAVYDPEADPAYTTPLPEDGSAWLEQAQALREASVESERQALPEEVRKNLEALGYTGE